MRFLTSRLQAQIRRVADFSYYFQAYFCFFFLFVELLFCLFSLVFVKRNFAFMLNAGFLYLASFKLFQGIVFACLREEVFHV